MDATPAAIPALRFNRFLPYWAVLQADFKATFHSWIYRVWVVLTMGATAGYLIYRYGAKEVAGMMQPGAETIGDLFKWVVFGSLTIIIVLTSGAICSERGTMADSVLSRGISRYQYFLGKWHARLLLVLLTFMTMSTLALVSAFFLLHSDNLTLNGCLAATLVVSVLLVGVITCGVSVSAVSNNTIVSIAVVWVALYGSGFVLSLLPGHIPSPDRALQNLPNILKGLYDWNQLLRIVVGSLAGSFVVALIGMIGFSRRDV